MNMSVRAQDKKHPPRSLSAGSPVQPGAQGGGGTEGQEDGGRARP